MKFNWAFVFFIFIHLSVAAQVSNPVLTSRWFHPKDKLDTLNTMNMIKTYKPARIDWTYCDEDKILQNYRTLNIPYSLAINPQTSDSAGFTTIKTRIITANGLPYVASWMNWKMKAPFWGCVNNPTFKKVFYDKTVKLIDLKPYAIFVDDALFNIQLQKEKKDLVGCFCPFCINNFYSNLSENDSKDCLSEVDLLPEIRKYIEGNKKDSISTKTLFTIKLYKESQNQAVINFLKDWKNKILAYNPSIKTLTNNSNGSWNNVYRVFDGGISELQTKNLNTNYLDSVFAVADNFKKTQSFTLVSSDKYAQNYLIAYLHTKHRDYFIPWDLYIPTSNPKVNRYYTNTNELKSFLELLKSKNTKIGFADNLGFSNNNKWYNIQNSENVFNIIISKNPIK